MQAEVKPIQHGTAFIIEHMESYLYNWCLSQYLEMKKYLQNTKYQLWITNTQVIEQFSCQQIKEDSENYKKAIQQIEENKRNWDQLKSEFQQDSDKYRLIQESITTFHHSEQIQKPICMLDLRAQKELNPTEQWGTLIFGGILGDHPPRDRPAPVRQHFSHIRHLGDIQLATDTAVLVSKLILGNKIKLSDIPMIREPQIKGQNKNGEKTKIQMEGFSYVSKQLNIETGQRRQGLTKKQKKQIYMSEGVKQLLIEEDLNSELIM